MIFVPQISRLCDFSFQLRDFGPLNYNNCVILVSQVSQLVQLGLFLNVIFNVYQEPMQSLCDPT